MIRALLWEDLKADFARWVDECCVPIRAEQAAPLPMLFNSFSVWSLQHRDMPLITRSTFTACLHLVRQELFHQREPGEPVFGLALRPPEAAESVFEEERLVKGEITGQQWLANFLSFGPRAVPDIRESALEAGFAWGTIESLKTLLGVRSMWPGIWSLDVSSPEPRRAPGRPSTPRPSRREPAYATLSEKGGGG